jgi:hypothetical protein
MSTDRRKWTRTALGRLRDLALTLLVVGGIQILLSLPVWALLFRLYPLGFSMALSLIGFASWLLASLLSFGLGRRPTGGPLPDRSLPGIPGANPFVDHIQTQLDRSGCGFVLFLSSVIPLGLAFVLRVHADLQAGRTWNDIFPPLP